MQLQLHLFAINIFVLPIAFGGLMQFTAAGTDADPFVLTLPMLVKNEALSATSARGDA